MKNNATNSPVLTLVYGAAIAAIYVVLTMVFLPISFGPIQFRISELLCVLPYFTPAAIPGLFIGCLLANFLGGAAALDVIFGSIATLIGAVGSYLRRKNRYLHRPGPGPGHDRRRPEPGICSHGRLRHHPRRHVHGADLHGQQRQRRDPDPAPDPVRRKSL